MAKKSRKQTAKTKHHTAATRHTTEQEKVGSDRLAAEHFAGEHDFGIPAEGAGRFVDAAQEAKYQPGGDHHSDPRPPRSGEQGTRDSGVGGVDSGPGSSSGGDLDTDLIGAGTHGSGVSLAGPDRRKEGPDMIQGGSKPQKPHVHVPKVQRRGTMVNRSDADSATTGNATGASAVTSFETGDDAAAGEISQGEAAGDDNTEIDNLS